MATAKKPRIKYTCVRCGMAVKRPTLNAQGMTATSGHRVAQWDRPCGRWAYREEWGR